MDGDSSMKIYQPRTSLKGRFPFRLGTTSYIIPDEIIPNLHYLVQQVDDVELVLFESDEFSNMPEPSDVQTMRKLADSYGLTYTVHLPLDIRLGSADEAERSASVQKCQRVIDRMAPLDPFAWVLHLHGDQRGTTPSVNVPVWLAQNARSVEEIIQTTGSARAICVETLDYDYQLVAELIESFDLAVCLDIGHLVLNQYSVSTHLDRWLERTRVVHLHGVRQEQDHVDISHLESATLDELISRLSQPCPVNRVVTLEVFGETEFADSINVLENRLNRSFRPL